MNSLRIFAAATILVVIASIQAQAADKLTLLLDWFVNPDHAPVILAEELGYFAEAGLDVEIVAPADPSAPPRLVAAKQADIAISYQPSLHQQIEEGLPLVRIGTIVETPLNSLVVLKDGPIKSIADLKGKKVGFSIAGFEDALLGMMLENAGLQASDVEMVNVNFSLSPSLITGNVDAVIGAFRNFELNQMDIVGHPGSAYFPEENGVPIYDELIFVAHKNQLDDDRFVRFLTAIEQATVYLTNHPQEGLGLFLAAYPDLNDELNKRAWFDTLPRFAKRPMALDIGRYNRFGAFMMDRGLTTSVPALETYAVDLSGR
jgi:putative hydroxymethylpyrimidine transport system substrate-binding protein